jgi:hypothetical protein
MIFDLDPSNTSWNYLITGSRYGNDTSSPVTYFMNCTLTSKAMNYSVRSSDVSLPNLVYYKANVTMEILGMTEGNYSVWVRGFVVNSTIPRQTSNENYTITLPST